MVVLFVFADTKIKGFETHAQNACLPFHFSDDADELEHNLVPVSSPLSPLAPVSLHLLPLSVPYHVPGPIVAGPGPSHTLGTLAPLTLLETEPFSLSPLNEASFR